jgi:mevalonate kinase
MANPAKPTRAGKAVKRGAGKRVVEGASFRLADEVRYVQGRAAAHDGRIVTLGQLLLFSTDTGDAWLLDRSDQLAARLARNGEPEPVHIEETDAAFTIGWKGSYRLDGPAFIYADQENGRIITILGYPTDKIANTA